MNLHQRILTPILALTMALLLCACGSTDAAAPSAAPTEAPTLQAALPDAALQKAVPAEAPRTQQTPEAEGDAPLKDTALACREQSVTVLFSAVGRPVDSNYAPSCLGPGEDGELYYEDFTVYTYREGDSEVVMDVE